MKTVQSIADVRAYVSAAKKAGKRVAFVPTMGNLHVGHLSLVDEAHKHADVVVCSIYVNPLQFGANEDIESYPRTFAQDQDQLKAAKVELLFAPSSNEIYPQGMENHCNVSVESLSDMHCGKSRPGHFTGVATVVCKLFNIVQPDVAVFGLKDFQQLAVIRKMTEDLYLPVEIIGAPIARSAEGLALSSRNGYLSPEELEIAPKLYQTLSEAKQALLNGQSYDRILRDATAKIAQAGMKPDYIDICDQATLHPARADEKKLVILVAAYLGRARLIDNLSFEL